MISFLSGYAMYTFTNIIIFMALSLLLHLQFGRTGIVNFGVVGFFGLGMYSFGVFIVKMSIPFLPSLLLATLLTALLAWGLGKLILNLDNQSILVATLAFATIIGDLTITEKGITNGVIGLGSVPFPINAGLLSQFVLFLIVLTIVVLLILYAGRMEASPYGRLLSSIQDNESLAKSLGKSTSREKLVIFTVTSALMGLCGTLYASNIHFLVPRMLDPATTFTVWIALIIGGRKRVLGGVVGIVVTLGIFDFLIETYVPIPSAQAQLLPVVKMLIYGLTLMFVLMFRPAGILGPKKLVTK